MNQKSLRFATLGALLGMALECRRPARQVFAAEKPRTNGRAKRARRLSVSNPGHHGHQAFLKRQRNRRRKAA